MNAPDNTAGAERYQPVDLKGRAQRLSIHVDESVQYRHHPLYTEIVHRAHARGLAGATVLRGIEGYGASNHIHTTRMLSLSQDLPLVVVIVDSEERIAAFLPELEQIVGDGLIVLEDVQVLLYTGRKPAETAS